MFKGEIPLPKVTITVEAETVTDLWDELAAVAEVFGEAECFLCKSKEIRPVSRPATKGKQTYIYREWVCTKCGSKMNLGQQEGGKLFPKRRLKENGEPCDYRAKEDGTYATQGWTKWRGPAHDGAHDDGDDGPPPAQAAPDRRSAPPRR